MRKEKGSASTERCLHLLRQGDASPPQRREAGRAVGLGRRAGTRVRLPLLPLAAPAAGLRVVGRRRGRGRPRKQLVAVRPAATTITIEDAPASCYVTANHVGRGY